MNQPIKNVLSAEIKAFLAEARGALNQSVNQPIKTVLSAEIESLLAEARGALNQSLIDKFRVRFTHNDGTLDPAACVLVGHINCLKSSLDAVEVLLKTPELKFFAYSVLHGAVYLCIALKRCAEPVNDEKVIDAVKVLKDDVEALKDDVEALKDIIGELVGSI